VLTFCIHRETGFTMRNNKTVLVDKALELFNDSKFQTSIDLLENNIHLLADDEHVLFRAYNILGHCYEKSNHLDKGVENYTIALNLLENSDDKSKISNLLNDIGRSHGRMENFGLAIEFFHKSLSYNKTNLMTMNNLGVAYMRIGKYDEALPYLLNAHPLCEEFGDPVQTIINLENIASIYLNSKRFLRAEVFLKKADKILLKIDHPVIKNSIDIHWGNFFILISDFEKAEKILLKAVKRSKELDVEDAVLNSLQAIIKLYKQSGRFQKVYKYQLQFIELKEKLYNDRLNSKLSELHSKFQIGLTKELAVKAELEREEEDSLSRLDKLKKDYATILQKEQFGIFSDATATIIGLADRLHTDRSIPVLIEGETGTGKEIVAHVIHFGREKLSKPFITINCAALNENLFETELFGYEKGSFSGGTKHNQIGKLELAQGGTIFLDEIGELPLGMQTKLLRVIQNKEMYRVGGNKAIQLDIRIIAATNRNLKEESEKGNFRLDLYHRLFAGYIKIPPLRERVLEISSLAQMFLLNMAKEKNKSFQLISPEAIKILENYSWPGNVRELKNVIERIVLLYDNNLLEPWHLDFICFNEQSKQNVESNKLYMTLPDESTKLDKLLQRILLETYTHFDKNVTQTANFLQISRNKVYRKIKT
jgi:transcriptional regulator with PAS, ATPase and Fis domain